MKRSSRRRGFWLLEALLAVTIFAIGVIALANAVNNCLYAHRVKQDDVRARLALGNRMAEIEAGSVKLADSKSDDLKGAFEGMRMKQTRELLALRTEKDEEIKGLEKVTLEVRWDAEGQEHSRQLYFYVGPP
jgi:Tfp pilus assembly protein PilV